MGLFMDMLAENRYAELRAQMIAMNPVDVAHALEDVDPDRQLLVFSMLPKDRAAAVFTYLESDLQRQIVDGISRHRLSLILNELPVDDAVDFLEELPANMVNAILSQAGPEKRGEINNILKYPENSAGSLMTVEYVILSEGMTAAEALANVRRQGGGKETIYTCYVVGAGRKLTGAVSLRRLILSPEDSLVHDIMSTPVIHTHTLEDQEEVADRFKEYDLLAMPVVDREGRLVGIITIDDIVDVIEAENTEDFEKMAALHPSGDEYLKTGVWRLARNRIVWLLVMMISATFTGAIIYHFQELLQTAVILAAFIPMLMDTGGNCGAQVSTLVIRGMAVGEIELENWLRVLWKEVRVGLVVGAALAAVNLLRLCFLVKTTDMQVNAVVTATLFITIVFAKLIGGILPMAAKRLRCDPALMASPMITTIVDAFSLTVYFTIAHVLLSI